MGVTSRRGLVVGRELEDGQLALLAAEVERLDGAHPVQLLHHDDARRVDAAIAAGELPPDAVAVAPGAVPAASLARVLGVRARGRTRRPVLTPSPRVVVRWSADDALADLELATAGTTRRRGRIVRVPGHARLRIVLPPPDTPPADGAPLVHAAPDGVRGELDGPVDPRFPTYSSVNLSEALPGPATALSLTTVAVGTSAAGTAFTDLVPIGGVVDLEGHARTQVVLGHRPYVNLGFVFRVAGVTPGMDTEVLADQMTGRSSAGVDLAGDAPIAGYPPGRARRAWIGVSVARDIRRLLRLHRSETERYVRHVERLRARATAPASIDDDALADLLRLARDLVVTGWYLGGRNVLAVQTWSSVAVAVRRDGAASRAGAELASVATLREVAAVAALAQGDEGALAALKRGARLDELRRDAPAVAARVDVALARVGHRGPGECELANRTFGDDPGLFLAAVARSLDAAAPPGRGAGGARGRGVERRVAAAQLVRERCRDELVRATHVLRLLARERGRRLAAAGVVDAADHVFHLTFDEVLDPPAAARAVVAHRRAERDRLARITMPMLVTGASWRPEAPPGEAAPGDEIAGLGASPGVARGPVRHVDAGSLDALEPGDVLVANATDVGFTIAFAYAAAVVTDVGGLMSHAAIVAREHGIPAVVDTGDATARLPEGAVVEVDGATGRVLVLAAGA